MKKISVAFASFCLTVASYAAYVGVMADTVTGNVALPALESRIGDWNAITNRPASVATAFNDAPTFGWVGQFVADAVDAVIATNAAAYTNEPLWKANSNSVLTHVGLTASNVHGITAAMIGAVTSNDFTNGIAQAVAPLVSTSTLVSTLVEYSTTGQLSSSLSAYVPSSGGDFVASYSKSKLEVSKHPGGPLYTANSYSLWAWWTARFGRSSSTSQTNTLLAIQQWIDGAHEGTEFIFKETNQGNLTSSNSVKYKNSGLSFKGMNLTEIETVTARTISSTNGATGELRIVGKLSLTDTNFVSVGFDVSTNGTATAKSFRKVSSGVTSTVPTSVTYNGTNYVADTNGLVNLGTIVGVDPNAWQKSDTVTNAVDLFARRAATNAQGMASNSWQKGDVVTNAFDSDAWHRGDVVTGVVASAVDDYARALASAASSVALQAVPQTRKLVVNGVTNDLSQDRAWTITAADIGAITQETYQGTITGAVVDGGSVTTNGGTLEITINPTGSGIDAATATSIAQRVIGASPASALSNVVFGATSTVMCATGTWYDAATRTAYTTSCPSGTGGGTSTVSAASAETTPLIYGYSTNTALLAGTNNPVQLLMTNATCPGPIYLSPPTKTNVLSDYVFKLVIPPLGTNTATWSSGWSTPTPTLSTNGFSLVICTSHAGQTNATGRRRY